MDDSDNLEEFFSVTTSNRAANAARFQAEYRILRRINMCLTAPGKHMTNPKPIMCGILFLRCQYAYKAAVGMSLSGQVTESFQMMRSCLEYAAYALAIFEKPELEAVWMSRNMTTDGMRAQKAAFRISEVRSAVERFDKRLAEIFNENYERAIDFGGHPNPHATMSTITMDNADLTGSFTVDALSVDPKVIRHAMKSTAQVGLTAAHIFQHIFPTKFELLGVKREMQKLRNENL
ncbi:MULTISPECIES: hypothetical protein [unclassified Bradyrhizobium]|uniref:hypothetical protein n=1 Tax=unclassified Bradyrhizobium TaxID=2631580 RepID=UPI0028EDA419|nr:MULTISPECIES: hypothetical protein [unclassified Bradyrhizobium]